MSEPTKKHADYTVAWVCSLPLEAAAAQTVLDKVHPRLTQTAADQNAYALGEISGLNIVVACLPSGNSGPVSAAVMLSQILAAFTGIRYGVMVGVGSGIPKTVQNEMWLGDVVVSQPTSKETTGVIVFDSGKPLSDEGNLVNAINNRPPQSLLDALSHMQSDNEREGSLEIAKSVSQALDEYPEMAEQFSMPERMTDRLFEREYLHPPNEPDCEMCEHQYLIDRTPRTSEEPRVHYGLIASGNQLLQDSTTRDSLAEQSEALCLEMQASELMNQLPFLVVRGICDYCDSHRSKHWQGYAAMTAATYAKILLSRVRQPNITKANKVDASLALSLLKDTLLDKTLGESDEAASLVDNLQCSLLAIVQAAGYINENRVPINTYLSLVESEDESMLELLGEDFGDEWRYPGVKNPIIMTWLVSLRRIQRLDTLAAHYLSSMSCLAPAWIPLALLPAAKSNVKQQSALGLLKAYQFITEHTESDTQLFSMHPLLQLATRNWLKNQNMLSHWVKQAGQDLKEAYPHPYENNRTVWRTYLPHAQYLLDNEVFQESKLDRAELAQKVGWCMYFDGRPREAEVLVRDALAVRKFLLGPEDSLYLEGMHLLAMCLGGYGNFDVAEKVMLALLKKRRLLDANSIEILTIVRQLAGIHIEQERHEEAETLLTDLHDQLKQVFGDGHPQTLASMVGLGDVYSRQEKYQRAEEILLEVLPKYNTIYGGNTLMAMDVKAKLAEIYENQSRLSEAEDLRKERLRYSERTYGPYHEITLNDQYYLTCLCYTQGRLQDAKSLGSHLHTQSKTVLGPDHPLTVMSAVTLSLIYIAQDNDPDAERMLLEVLPRIQKIGYGEDDETALLNMELLAQVKSRQGKLAEAEAVYAKVLELQTSKLG